MLKRADMVPAAFEAASFTLEWLTYTSWLDALLAEGRGVTVAKRTHTMAKAT
jgi:hypothetical protein